MDELKKMTSLTKTKFCPLIKGNCIEEKCAWWSESDFCCNVALLDTLPTQQL